MDQNTRDILQTVLFIKEKIAQLPTEERVREILHDLVPSFIRVELKSDPNLTEIASIRHQLEELTEQFANVSGFRKEIDHALERIVERSRNISVSIRTSHSSACERTRPRLPGEVTDRKVDGIKTKCQRRIERELRICA